MSNKLVPSIKALAEEWMEVTMPILFSQLFPKEYNALEKKINEKNKKGQSVIVTMIASFIKPFISEMLKYINVQELYDGLVSIAQYIGAEDLVEDDVKYLYKYTPKRVSAENKKILTNDINPKKQPKPSPPKLDIQKELEESRRMVSELTTSYHDIKKQDRPMQTAAKKYVYGLEDINEDVYVPSEENIFKNSKSTVVYGTPDMSPLTLSFIEPTFRQFEALKPQSSMFQRIISPAAKMIDVIEPIMPKPQKIHEYRVKATLRPTFQLREHKVKATLRPTRKTRKTKGDPADPKTWPVVDLKDFMREHNLKGVSKKKSVLVEIIKNYIR